MKSVLGLKIKNKIMFSAFFNKKRKYSGDILRALLLPLAFLTVSSIFFGIMRQIGEDHNFYRLNETIVMFTRLSCFLISLFPIFVTIGIATTFTKKYVLASVLSILGWITFIGIQSVFIHENSNGTVDFLFYRNVDNRFIDLFGSIDWMKNVSPNIFIAIVFGFIIIVLLNKTSKFRVFKFLNFNRIVFYILPFVIFILVILHFLIMGSVIYLLNHLSKEQNNLAKTFLFACFEKALFPLGLDSNINKLLNSDYIELTQSIQFTKNNMVYQVSSIGGVAKTNWSDALGIIDDNNLKIRTEILYNTLANDWSGKEIVLNNGDKFLFNMTMASKINAGIVSGEGFKLLLNNYSFGSGSIANLISTIFIVPMIGIVLICNAEKGQKLFATQILIASILSSFFLGTQNIVLYIVLFSTPVFFVILFVFILPLFQLMFAYIGVQIQTVNGGFIELIRNGFIPYVKGAQNGFWLFLGPIIFISVALILIYWAWTKLFKPNTPGIGNCNSELITAEQTHSISYMLFYKRNDFAKEINTKEFFVFDQINDKAAPNESIDEFSQYSNISDTQMFDINKEGIENSSELSTTQEVDVTHLMGVKNSIETKTFSSEKIDFAKEKIIINSPVYGTLVEKTKDNIVFNVNQKKNNIYAPVEGVVEYISPEYNEIILSHSFVRIIISIEYNRSDQALLFKFINTQIKVGQKVNKGELLLLINNYFDNDSKASINVNIQTIKNTEEEINTSVILNKTSVSKTSSIFVVEN
ncbi:hypothetical protein [Mycoplasma phocoenae]|uniref:Uncharacterized protein n=1 Tax=Mycoplasma phocoenae TaxID=754517 RepID=A0A858U428_9MOLU|nr:hypothetical protein [Mycoplasma phocoenae]QJG66819.1 hypothetical protein HGG69_00525 [Mycoplasma phocoenae]